VALEFYKKGQGFYTRVGTAIGVSILSLLGCWSLYNKLEGLSLESAQAQAWVQAGIPAVLLLILALVIYKILNKPNIADFMIATEGEMKKVSWSTKKEIITSTKVVIVTVISLSLMLAGVDFFFLWFFRTIGVLTVS
jgi:preprotein translocase subunit SecE